MLVVLKAARRPLSKELEQAVLDRAGWRDFHRLVHRLSCHHHFEHLGRKQIREIVHDAVARHREAPAVDRLKAPALASADLLTSFERFQEKAPDLLAAVDVEAGTSKLLLERARARVGVAFGLLRQQNLFGFPAKIYLEQAYFALNGTWTWQNGDTTARAGWWRSEPAPIPMDLSHDNGAEWKGRLEELSDLYRSLPRQLQERVDVCLEWLEVAALSDRWRIIIPAILSAMEAVLVPETIGLKAEVVTVRSAACGKESRPRSLWNGTPIGVPRFASLTSVPTHSMNPRMGNLAALAHW